MKEGKANSPSPLRGGLGRGWIGFSAVKPFFDPLRNARQSAVARKLRQNLSPVEQKIWLRLRANALGVKFRRQQPILNYITDFCCMELKLVIEIDGDTHAISPQKDRARDLSLSQAGYKVLRYTNSQAVNELDDVVEDIYRHVQRLLSDPLPNPPRKGEGIS